MGVLSRRQLLQISGLTAGSGALAACSSSGEESTAKRNYLTWWDHQGNQGTLHKKIFAEFRKRPGGMRVEYTFRNASKMGQALQLAKQSNQLPDVHTNAGLQIPVPQLIAGGWVAPLDLTDAAMSRLKGHLLDGVHVFDGKVYSFPQFNDRTYSSATWFNTKLIVKAGLDPNDPPATYDDMRKAARAVRDKIGGSVYGLVWNAGMPPRMEDQINDLAQAGGFEGGGGMLYRTGEFAYHSDPYLNAIELLLSLAKDKLIMPGATTFSDEIARARWVSGAAGYYIDGPWCPGVVRESFADFADSIGVGPILVPESGMPVHCYAGPQGGVFWLSANVPAKRAKAANLLFSDFFTTKKYFTDLAGWMPQPPLDLSAIPDSIAYPSYKKLAAWMGKQVYLAPSPVVRNIEVTKVQAETNQIQPTLGDIVQGALSGDVDDVKGALKDLSDKSAAEQERAIKAATAKGAHVSADDYAFPDWKPGQDFTTAMYHK
ncbi:MAG TPA: extracellular solute-binding protein [Mycobacteriales bacterium]|nr:extracellular solute-binding protein [Mycobacteriales bacterium]